VVEKIVVWVERALEGDDLTNFCRVTQLLSSFSQHGQLLCCTMRQISNIFQGRLGDIISVSRKIAPSAHGVVSAVTYNHRKMLPCVVLSAIVRWLGRDVPKAFGVATTTLYILAQPCMSIAICTSAHR
jgi:hypothetical protein